VIGRFFAWLRGDRHQHHASEVFGICAGHRWGFCDTCGKKVRE
jgi:hypothetical protein